MWVHLVLLLSCAPLSVSHPDVLDKQFVFVSDVIPTIQENLVYSSEDNIAGRRLDGYTEGSSAILTKEAAKALANVQNEVAENGYSLLIYDAYHPKMTLNDLSKYLMKRYPHIDNKDLKPFLVKSKIGSCTGNAVDVTLVLKEEESSTDNEVDLTDTLKEKRPQKISQMLLNMFKKILPKRKRTENINNDTMEVGCSSSKREEKKSKKRKREKEEIQYVDMGSSFDTFDECSAHGSECITEKQAENRKYLMHVMKKHGFDHSPNYWWHYTLSKEKLRSSTEHNFFVLNKRKTFVFVSDIHPEIRENLLYNSPNNITGEVLPGYATNARAMLKLEAAEALANVQEEVAKNGYSLLIYDAYHPRKTYDKIDEWVTKIAKTGRHLYKRHWREPRDEALAIKYYPGSSADIAFYYKSYNYEAKRDNIRGFSVDLTLISNQKLANLHEIKWETRTVGAAEINYMNDGSVDMGSSFDTIGYSAHDFDGITPEQTENRAYLKEVMTKYGFRSYDQRNGGSWWHYTYGSGRCAELYDFDVMEKDVMEMTSQKKERIN